MIIVLKKHAPEHIVENIQNRLTSSGFIFNVIEGVKYTVIPVVGDFTMSDISRFKAIEGVDKVLNISRPYYLSSKDYKPKTVIDIDGVKIGESFSFIAGPCSVESEESLEKIALNLAAQGVKILRGGTYKMRTSPYSFQGLGENGLKILRRVADRHNMKVISEIADIRQLDQFAELTDIIQIGARNMSNFSMLKEIGRLDKPCMLKRSPSSTIDEFLLSAEHIMSEGNEKVILCERGIISFDSSSRNSVNIASIPILKDLSHLPVFLDPSHGIGVAKYIPNASVAAYILGADGIIVETHYDPSVALSDGFQSITIDSFAAIKDKISLISSVLEK